MAVRAAAPRIDRVAVFGDGEGELFGGFYGGDGGGEGALGVGFWFFELDAAGEFCFGIFVQHWISE